MSNIALYIIGIACCLVCSAFFSASEMSYSTCNKLRLENLKEEGNKKAKSADYIVNHFDDALSAILIGNNLANIASSSMATLLAIAICGGSEKYTWLSTLLMTLLVIIFGETVPKITAKKNANRFSLAFAYITRTVMIVLFPVVWLVVLVVNLVSKLFKVKNPVFAQEDAVVELQNLIETAQDESVLDEERSELIRSAIDFHDISAYEVMTARVDVYAIDAGQDDRVILQMIEESPYSRLPVYENSKDNIIGILYLNHYLKAAADGDLSDIKDFLMKPVYVYKTMKLPDVLAKLKEEKQHLAIVADEYGGTLGVLSMEDVLEEIVGEIWDETDTVEDDVVKLNEGELEVDGDITVSYMLDLIGIPEKNFDAQSETIGGWTVEMLGDYPSIGDSFEYSGFSFSILKIDGRRVEKVLIKKLDKKKEK